MKRIIITGQVKQYAGIELYEKLKDVEFFTAYSNEEAVNIHRKEKGHLIVIGLYGSGMNAVTFCSRIREDSELRRVSIIVFCRDNEIELGESARCRANAVMTFPPDQTLLLRNVRQFLAIPSRGSCHIGFKARVGGSRTEHLFDGWTGNISVTGMMIEANADLNRGDRILCSLVLPPATSFETQAEIVWTVKSSAVDRNRYGVRFSRLDLAARQAIETLVGQHPRP